MNINDQIRKWQDVADSGSANDLRRIASEMIGQLQLMLRNPPETTEVEPDVLADQVAKLTGTMQALSGTLAGHERAGRKRIDVKTLRDILEAKA